MCNHIVLFFGLRIASNWLKGCRGNPENIGVYKVDGRMPEVLPAAIELSGLWGEGMVLVFKMAVALASQEGKNLSTVQEVYL